MIFVPLVAVVVLALVPAAWSPIFAVIFFAIGFVGFLVYVGLRPRADQRLTGPASHGAERGPHEPSDRAVESRP